MCLSNLTNKQWRLVDTLKSSDEHIAREADKNLGGCATERPIYMRKGVDEHWEIETSINLRPKLKPNN